VIRLVTPDIAGHVALYRSGPPTLSGSQLAAEATR
jgi:hypothetical protein